MKNVTILDINLIKENPDNPRNIKVGIFKKLVKSLEEFPKMLEIRPLVVTTDYMVLGGNMRLRAAREAGLTQLPVIIATELTEAEQKQFIIKDNLGYGDWDFVKLVEHWDIDLLTDWGLEIPKIEIKPIGEDEFESDLDKIETDIVEGDLITIGPHRLFCGDSTNPQHVEQVLNGTEPYLMVTDPPYGVEYDPAWRDKTLRKDGSKRTGRAVGEIKGDDRCDWSEAYVLAPSCVAYVYHGAKFAACVADGLENNQFEIRAQIIWAKNNHVIGRGNYHWQHEPCWYAVKSGAKAQWIGDRSQSTIWNIDKPAKSETGHSTQKPIECMARPIRNHEGDVYDPFIGSGSTMIAAHQLGRVCYGIEINPKYCQVIINRMKNLYPELVVDVGRP